MAFASYLAETSRNIDFGKVVIQVALPGSQVNGHRKLTLA